MGDWAVAIAAGRCPIRSGMTDNVTPGVTGGLNRKDGEAVELAAMFLAFECTDHLLHEVIDVEHLKFDRRVVDRDREVIGDVVAEGRDGAVVVRAAPFAVEVRETVNKHLHAILLSVLQEEVLPCFLAPSVLTVAETAGQRGLGTAGEHHRGFVAVLLQGVKQGAGKAEVAFHKVLWVLRTVDSGKVKDKVAFGTPLVQLRRGAVEVVLEDLIDYQITVTAGLAAFDVIELGAKVPAHKTLGACYQNLHYFARLAMPLSSFWMYSREAIFSLVSSRFRRRVLSELNSSMVTRFVSPSVKNLS